VSLPTIELKLIRYWIFWTLIEASAIDDCLYDASHFVLGYTTIQFFIKFKSPSIIEHPKPTGQYESKRGPYI